MNGDQEPTLAALTENEDRAAEDEGRRTARASFATRAFVLAGAGLLVAGLIFQYSTLHAVRDTQQTTAPLTHSIATTDDRIVALQRRVVALQQQISDCVTPGGVCYQRTLGQGKANITAIIGGTNEAALYYAYCADKPGQQSLRDLRSCAAALLLQQPAH